MKIKFRLDQSIPLLSTLSQTSKFLKPVERIEGKSRNTARYVEKLIEIEIMSIICND